MQKPEFIYTSSSFDVACPWRVFALNAAYMVGAAVALHAAPTFLVVWVAALSIPLWGSAVSAAARWHVKRNPIPPPELSSGLVTISYISGGRS